jgi:hypothetical protein
MRFVVDEVVLEQASVRVLRYFPANLHSTIAPYASITAPRFEVLTAVSTKMAVFWVVAWWNFTDVSEALAAD